jgi:hypothetical protein
VRSDIAFVTEKPLVVAKVPELDILFDPERLFDPPKVAEALKLRDFDKDREDSNDFVRDKGREPLNVLELENGALLDN